MKRIFAIVLGLGLILLTSCQHKELEPYSLKRGETGEVNITVYASDAISVRSGDFYNSALGGVSNVSGYYLRYILAVYDEQGNVVVDPQTKVVTSGGTVFSATLTEGETYTFVAWADFVTDQSDPSDLHYDTSDLRAVTYVSGDDSYLNDESRDAYYYSDEVTVDGSAISLTLKRPFAKLRLVATDWASSPSKPSSIDVTYSKDRYTLFDALTGESSSEASAYTYNGTIDVDESYYTGGYDGSEYNYRTVSVDYILVGSEESDIKLSYTTYDDSGAELHSYDIVQDVPLVRNCLTTVIGKLLSASSESDINVEIDDSFDNEYDVNIGTITLPDDVEYTTVDGKSYPAVHVGETLDLSASVSEITKASTDESWTWASEDETVATVEDGVVTGVAEGGPVVISATQSDGSHITAYACVSVCVLAEEEVPEEPTEGGVAVDETSVKLPIDKGTYTVAYSEPDDAAQTLTWASSDADVVTVADGVITVVGFGDATVTVSSDATDLADGYASSAEIAVSVPYGYYDEAFTSETTNWALNPSQSSSWVWSSDGYYTITTTAGRGDIGHLTTNSHGSFGSDGSFDVYLDPSAYPIVCFRIDDVADYTDVNVTQSHITIDTSGNLVSDDTKYSGGLGGTNNKWGSKYSCSDGSAILVYNLSEKTLTKTDSDTGDTSSEVLPSTAHFSTFQIKYADIQVDDATPASISYRYFWFKTFASTSALESYLGEWSSETGITYEVAE